MSTTTEQVLHVGTLHVRFTRRATSWLTDGSLNVYCPLRHFAESTSTDGLRFPALHRHAPDPDDDWKPNLVATRAVLFEEVHLSHRGGHPHFVTDSVEVADLSNAAVEAVADDLLEEQVAELKDMLQEYQDIWAESYKLPTGKLNPDYNMRHQMTMMPVRPNTQRPYRYSQYEQEFIIETVKKLLAAGLIKPSHSSWVSPIVLTRKKCGGLRFNIDMRAVNQASLPHPYPLPDCETLLRQGAGYRYNSSVDIADAFWCMEMDPASTQYTAMATPIGVFEWNRLCFGLRDGSSSWQAAMDKVINEGLQGTNPVTGQPYSSGPLKDTFAFVDDTLCRAHTWPEHMAQLRALFQRLREAGLRARLKKSVFCARKLRFVGFIIGEAGVEVDGDRISAILALPLPRSVKELRSLLGMVNYFRPHLPRLAEMVAPLQAYTKKGASIPTEWSPAELTAFAEIKTALTTAPVLAAPRLDPGWQFVLVTDWSRVAMAACLMQKGPDNQEVVIAYASRACTPAESRLGASEGECAAVVWGVQKFRYWLHGRTWLLRTDHQSLVWLASARFNNAKLERWCLRLQEHSYIVQHISGKSNTVADHLSRCVSAALQPIVCAGRPSRRSQQPAPAPYWPATAEGQAALDSVPCSACGGVLGFDNICICEGCGICTHLRCVVPPRTTAPTGPWYCAQCDPQFLNGLEELRDASPTPALPVSPHDPYALPALQAFLDADRAPSSLEHLPERQRRAVLRYAGNVLVHEVTGWFLLKCGVRNTAMQRWLLCPPPDYRWGLVQMVHEALGHAGIGQTLTYMHQHWHWRGMRTDISSVLRCCDACQRRHLVAPEHPPYQEPDVYGPFNHTHVDLSGPMPYYNSPPTSPSQTPDGYVQVVVMVDYFTKVVEFALAYSRDSHVIAKILWDHWLARYPLPKACTTDCGTEFGHSFAHLLHRLGVRHIRTSVAHPSANGAVERLMRSWKAVMATLVNDCPYTWRDLLPTMRMAFLHRVHSATGHSPLELLTGLIPRLPLPVGGVYAAVAPAAAPVAVPAAEPARALVWAIDEAVFANIRHQFARNAAALQRRRAAARRLSVRHHPLRVGDLVLELLESAVSPLHAACKGPFRIVSVSQDGTIATLETGDTHFKSSKRYRRHLSRLTKYFARGHTPPLPHP